MDALLELIVTIVLTVCILMFFYNRYGEKRGKKTINTSSKNSSDKPKSFVKRKLEIKEKDLQKIIWYIAILVTIILLIIAIYRKPWGRADDFFTILRIIVTAVSAYSAFSAYQLKKGGLAWVFGIIAIIFNPLLPIKLHRETWKFIDFIVACIYIIFIVSQIGLNKISPYFKKAIKTIRLREAFKIFVATLATLILAGIILFIIKLMFDLIITYF